MQKREPVSIVTDSAEATPSRPVATGGGAVEILALTADHQLLGTLRAAVGSERRVWHAPGYRDAVELIMAGRVGVAIVDTMASADETAPLCQRLREQFPDLVLIVTGSLAEQTQLVSQITAGEIFRFMHKPVSEARARQFIDTSVRRHLEARTALPTGSDSSLRTLGKPFLITTGAAAAVILVIVVIAALLSTESNPVERVSAPPTVQLVKPPPPTTTSGPAGSTAARTPPDAASEAPSPAKTVTAAPSPAKPVRVAPARQASPSTAAAKTPKPTKPVVAAKPATREAPQRAATPVPVEPAPVEPSAAEPEPAVTTTAEPAKPQLSPEEAFLANVVPITALERERQVNPVYPSRAQRNSIEGWVELDFTVDVAGRVKDLQVRDSSPQGTFEKAASDALRQWRFKPVMREGRAVEQRARVRLRFQMQ